MTAILTRHEGPVTILTLNRPEKLNAFAGSMREELAAALDLLAKRDETRAVVLTGAGRAFCAGGDVEAMARMQESGDRAGFGRLLDAGRTVVTKIAALPQPVIAMVNGVAAGAGCNLALACDYRIASSEARLGQTFVKIGLHPDWGGTWTLPRLVGPSRAMEIMMTGRLVPAGEALRIGMVDRVEEPEGLERATMDLARAIAEGPPLAIRGIKRAVRGGGARSLEDQLALENEHQAAAFASEDGAEGIRAFLEKRPPGFRGR